MHYTAARHLSFLYQLPPGRSALSSESKCSGDKTVSLTVLFDLQPLHIIQHMRLLLISSQSVIIKNNRPGGINLFAGGGCGS
jgi:hypothetical protein